MKKRDAMAAVERHADELRGRGISHVYLFGSTARDRAGPESDVDLFFDLRRGAKFSLFDLLELREFLGGVLKARADAIPRRGLHRVVRRNVERNAVRVF
jgi:predicted nucleotidyltransferase